MKLRVFALGLAVAILPVGNFISWNNSLSVALDYKSKNPNIQNEKKQNNIPEDAIRLRIVANSNTGEDQRVKRLVRDHIVGKINSWLKQGDRFPSHEEVQRLIIAHMEELKQNALHVLARKGVPYGVEITFGNTPFPAKWYDGKVYPAGIYKVLLVTLGEGSGQNWWCVMFPELCFVDSSTAQTEKQDQKQHLKRSFTVKDIQDKDSVSEVQVEETEVRVFLWEALKALGSYISSMWNAIFKD